MKFKRKLFTVCILAILCSCENKSVNPDSEKETGPSNLTLPTEVGDRLFKGFSTGDVSEGLFEYTYNDDCQLIKQKAKELSSLFSDSVNIEYDDNGVANKIINVTRTSTFTATITLTMSYNSAGLYDKIEVNNGSDTFIHTFVYDDRNRLIAIDGSANGFDGGSTYFNWVSDNVVESTSRLATTEEILPSKNIYTFSTEIDRYTVNLMGRGYLPLSSIYSVANTALISGLPSFAHPYVLEELKVINLSGLETVYEYDFILDDEGYYSSYATANAFYDVCGS
jgi:hypothetical protein